MKYESGRSMIEMLGVLTIMGLITASAIGGVSYLLNNQKQSDVKSDVVQIVMGVREIFAGYNDFSALNSNIFSAIGMSDNNPLGGKYSLSVDSVNPQQFVLTIDGLNKSACEYFMTNAWTDSVGYMASNGTQSGATGSCSGDGNTNIVYIAFGA